MAHSDHFRLLYDARGDLYSVMLSAALWERGHHRLEATIHSILEVMEPSVRPEPLAEWEDFKTYWDFQYPACMKVVCGNCKTQTENWLSDPAKPFRLKSAQLGGLVVFHCNTCGATVRKKHFKDHICFEFSIAGSCLK
jgi:hypothetical protein